MQDVMVSTNNMMHLVGNALAASQFDLILAVCGIVGYIILVCFRKSHAVQEFHKKVDVTFEESQDSEVTETTQNANANSLDDILASTESFEDADVITADLDRFFASHPGHPFTICEVQTILKFCGHSLADKTLADRLLQCMQPVEEWHILNAFICFYISNKMSEKACDVFELNYATFFDIELDEHTEWQLVMAALKCGRQSLADHLIQTSQSDAAKQIVTIQQWWKRTSLQMGEERVERIGSVLNRLSSMFNERYPFEEEEEHSDSESTCFFGDDSDRAESSCADSDWEPMS